MELKRVFLGLVFLAIFYNHFGQGYKIDISIHNYSNDTVILGEYFTTRMIPKDTVVLNSKGKAVLEGTESFKGGLYILYLDPDHFFDFLLDKDQEIAIKTDTSDLIGKTFFKGSVDNELFFEYKKILQGSREKAEVLKDELANAGTTADSTRIKEVLEQLDDNIDAFYRSVSEDYPDHFITTFLAATRDPVPPESMLQGSQRENDSIKYMYFREHYLDHFDVSDVRLLHTPIYENKIKTYISRIVPQHPDSLKIAIDYLMEESRSDEELFRYMLITLFNHFAESKYMGMDVLYFYIAEKYYIPEATWSNPEFIIKLKDNLASNKPTLIGQTAPNFIARQIPPEHFQMAAMDTAIKSDPHIGEDFFIHDIQSKFTILYFWEADCGHCKKSTPALYKAYQRLKDKDVTVISVHVINSVEGKEKWVDLINEYELYDWINCWSPYSNDFRKKYNLQSFPQLFILNESKEIVAKKISPEQAESLINNLLKLESKSL